MRVVRMQLFSLIICSSEVESTHLRGVEKSLALFISQQLREDAFEAAFALENGGFHTCVLQELCGIDKGPTTGKCRFLRLGCHRRKGTGTRTRVRRCRRTQKGKPSRKPGIYPLILSSGTRKRIWALSPSWFLSKAGRQAAEHLLLHYRCSESLLGATTPRNLFTSVIVVFFPQQSQREVAERFGQ